MAHRILVIDDDQDLGNLLRQYLELHGFQVDRAYNGIDARTMLTQTTYDLLIVDVMMPQEDGFTLGRYLQAQYPQQAFLFVTARRQQADVLAGLRLGADDYITKPFDADELILRMNNILRRFQPTAASSEDGYAIGLYWFHPQNLLLTSPTTERLLTEKEAALLDYLWQHRSGLISRKAILEHLWGEADFFNGRSLDVFVSRLRKYLFEDSSLHIDSIRAVGFYFRSNK